MKPLLLVQLLAIFTFILGGCATAPRSKRPNPVVSAPSTKPLPNEAPDSPEEIDSEIQEFEDEIPQNEPAARASPAPGAESAEGEGDFDQEDLPVPVSKKHVIPGMFNEKVAEWIRYFSQKDRERFQRYLDRGEAYREVVENILDENNVPADLYYLGLIESGFNYSAKSSAKAVGVWQFMKSSGKSYGLNVDSYIDERKDPIRATEAAAKYLRDLYREFGSWYLALAAYNAGPGRIRGAIRRGRSHDFWELVERRKLPRETIDYVPKFLAARYIGDHPDLFAFYISEDKKYPDVELVKVPSPLRFASIEQKCSIPDGTLSFVNPQYVKDYTHPGRSIDEIWVPENYKSSVEKQFENLKEYRIRVKPERIATVRPVLKLAYHKVRRGESLKTIARREGLSVAYLKRVNGLRSDRVQPGQRLKLAATEYKQRRTHPRNARKRRRH